jgi:hypothetical protein
MEGRKRLKKFLRAAAILLLVLSGLISGCGGGAFTDPGQDDSSGGGGGGSSAKTLIITGISGVSGHVLAVLSSSSNLAAAAAFGEGYIANGTVTIQLKEASENEGNWTSSGSYYIFFGPEDRVYRTSSRITFSSGTTTVNWGQFSEYY